MPDYDLRLGERLEILHEDRRGISNVQMITKDGHLVISEPMDGTNRLPIKKNDVMRLFYYRAFGMLSCVITAERLFEENGITMIEAEIRSQFNRYQRRDFVRFETLLPVTIIPVTDIPDAAQMPDDVAVRYLIDRRLAGKNGDENAIGGFTLDISGGGLRFICKKRLELGSIAACVVCLNEEDSVPADIRIVRLERDSESSDKYLMGARFIGIEESLRNRVIRYIFNEQLKRRKNGKLT